MIVAIFLLIVLTITVPIGTQHQ